MATRDLFIFISELLRKWILQIGPRQKKSTGLSSRAFPSSPQSKCALRIVSYSAGIVLSQAPPAALKRMTPDWSEQNERWPLWPGAAGSAVEVYVGAGGPPADAAVKLYPLFVNGESARTLSTRQAPAEVAPVAVAQVEATPPRLVSPANPTVGYVVE
jgi:hypothetical protein